MSEEDSFLGCSDVVDAEFRIIKLLNDVLERTDARFHKHGDLPSVIRVTVRDRLAAKRENSDKSKTKEGHYFRGRSSRQCPIPLDHFHPDHPKRQEKLLNSLMQLFFRAVSVQKGFHLTLVNVAVARFQSFGGGGGGTQKGIDDFMSKRKISGVEHESLKRPKTIAEVPRVCSRGLGTNDSLHTRSDANGEKEPSVDNKKVQSGMLTDGPENCKKDKIHSVTHLSPSRPSSSCFGLRGNGSSVENGVKRKEVTDKDIDDLFDL
mmetsp:Transcript_10564/g.19284  ORF Transcript_10564/g.19284 Transcript_10564/m.19284 type:complete len:263 (+) Transcript_10564:160-948(+)|eukprot:CAMPEP_0197537328 /NCGR_PEP_ID=MMETSP1318-20131121/56548_1 /TAXON_ID=552666 /ORGANISM="Partenskyella glossopodia, Strain RCC365" /LENGTH=262 /DNA_ID=CAMNT_0043095467 /DNA_START=134 /DNA_END=922 /DNA_ORIENTATION=-